MTRPAGSFKRRRPSTGSFAHGEISTPLGSLHAYASERGLRALLFAGSDAAGHGVTGDVVEDPDQEVIQACAAQLQAYFGRELRSFDLPLDPVGTVFQVSAWWALREIPYGQTSSYARQAAAMGHPTAARAVGAANRRNPLTVIVPCHRVVGSGGQLTGFASGLENKRALLRLEGVQPWAGELLFGERAT